MAPKTQRSRSETPTRLLSEDIINQLKPLTNKRSQGVVIYYVPRVHEILLDKQAWIKDVEFPCTGWKLLRN